VSATYAWRVRAGPARGPASTTAEERSRRRDWNSEEVRSRTDFLGGRLVRGGVDVPGVDIWIWVGCRDRCHV